MYRTALPPEYYVVPVGQVRSGVRCTTSSRTAGLQAPFSVGQQSYTVGQVRSGVGLPALQQSSAVGGTAKRAVVCVQPLAMAAKLEAAEYMRKLALGEEVEGRVKNISPSGEGWRAMLYNNPPGWWPGAEKQFNGPTRAALGPAPDSGIIYEHYPRFWALRNPRALWPGTGIRNSDRHVFLKRWNEK